MVNRKFQSNQKCYGATLEELKIPLQQTNQFFFFKLVKKDNTGAVKIFEQNAPYITPGEITNLPID